MQAKQPYLISNYITPKYSRQSNEYGTEKFGATSTQQRHGNVKAAPSGLEEGQYEIRRVSTSGWYWKQGSVFHTLYHAPLNKFQNQIFNSAVDSGQKVFPKPAATTAHSWRININQTGKYTTENHLN